MTRILGEAQTGRSFCLLLLLAVALLLSVSTTAARADAAAAAGIERDLGALHVLGDSLRNAPPPLVPALVHPALADGSAPYLRNASLRRIAALQQRLETLEASAAPAPEDAGPRRTLTQEVQRLHWLLLSVADEAPAPVDLGATLERMSVAWARLMRPVAAAGSAPEPPRILRGTPL